MKGNKGLAIRLRRTLALPNRVAAFPPHSFDSEPAGGFLRRIVLLALVVTILAGCGRRSPVLDNLDSAKVRALDGVITFDKSGQSRNVSLCFPRANVTDADLEQIRSLPGLHALDLAGSPITDAGLRRLEGLDRLELLGLLGTRVTDKGMEQVGKLSGLRVLVLSETAIADAGLAHLRGLTRLRVLYLDATDISDDGLQHLQGLTALQTLILSRTRVSDAGLKALRQALPNATIER
jgi:hypothetical protein